MTQDQFKARFSWETTESGCWINPTGYHVRKDKNGYLPLITLQRHEGAPRYHHGGPGFSIRIHRLAYLTFKGSIAGRTLFHSCGDTHCFNPDHLQPSNHSQNAKCGRCGQRKPAARIKEHKTGGPLILCADCISIMADQKILNQNQHANVLFRKAWRRELHKLRIAFRKRQASSRAQNPDEIEKRKAKAADYFRSRFHNDPAFHMQERYRVRMNKMLRGIASGHTREMIGCDFCFFKSYIESQFTGSMSWANRNKWHLDHIRPISSFDLNDWEQVRQCFHYSNLRPVWAKTNMRKHDAWDGQLDMTHALLKTS